MNLYKLSICLLLLLSVQVKADNHCYDYPDDEDCKETTVDLLDLFTGNKNTDDSQYPDGTLEERKYSVFSDEGDHFKELVKQKKFLSASKLFNKYEVSFFSTKSTFGGESRIDKYKAEIKEVAMYFIDKYKDTQNNLFKDLDDSVQLINNANKSLSDNWVFFKSLIKRSNRLRDEYKKHTVIRYHQKIIRESGVIDRWGSGALAQGVLDKRNLLKNALTANALKEFDLFDFSSNKDFFKDYPVDVDKSEVVASSSKTIIKWLNNSSLDDAIVLIDKYKLNRPKTIRYKLAGILLDKASRATYGDKQPKFMDVVATLKQIQDLGVQINPDELPVRYKTVFVVINSTDDFSESNIKNVLSKKESYLVVIDKRNTNVQKSKGTLKKVESRFVSKREMVANQSYIAAKNRYNNTLNAHNIAVQSYQGALAKQEESRRQYQREQEMRQLSAGYNTNCTSIGNNINCSSSRGYVPFVPDYGSSFDNIGISIAKGKVNRTRAAVSNAERRLNNIPREVENLAHSDYTFTTRTYEVIKNYDYNIYVINKVTGKYFLTNLPQESKQTFVVTNDLNSEDANYSSTDFQTLDDIEMFISNQDEYSIGDLMSKIPSEYSLVNYSDIKELINSIRSSYQEPVSNAMGKSQADVNIDSNISQGSDYIKDLQRIKALLDSGVINQDDFETLKQKIINKL